MNTIDAAQIMMRKGRHFSAKELVELFGVTTSRAHSILVNIQSSPLYTFERINDTPLRIKVTSVDGESCGAPRWIDVLLTKPWPVKVAA